jgi:hypothetical protein
MNDRKTAKSVRTENSFARHTQRIPQRILSHLLAIASAIFLSSLLVSTPAMATDSCAPTYNETLKVDSYRHQPGDTVTVTGSGYEPSCSLRVVVTDPKSGSSSTGLTTDGSGNLSYEFTVNSLPGEWQVGTFMGDDTDPWTSAPVTNGPYIETDMPDYAPGNRVTITGGDRRPAALLRCEEDRRARSREGSDDQSLQSAG